MKSKQAYLILVIFFLLFQFEHKVHACSMYKITVDGKTMVGCNEDNWRTTSKIWFENAKKANEYGAAFTGSRQVSNNRTVPQSGMNTAGLTYSRLASYYPRQSKPFPNRIKITDEVNYLSDILHKCATVKEVKEYIEQYDHSFFIEDVFIYIDSTGKYLVVEPYNLIEGSEPTYVLSNFCPSITAKEDARKLERYRKGEEFLNTHELNSSLSFCSALSDSMHVCRSRNGDGTLLTSIWDTKEGLVNLYFYHDYQSSVQFKLTEALSKGDHHINIAGLFPKNLEFERLATYITPFNTNEIRVALVVLGGFLAFFSLLLVIVAFRNKNAEISVKNALLISIMNLLLTAYLFVLATNIYIYYFDAPYEHYSSKLISASSYTPFLLLLTIIPFTLFTVKRFKSVQTKSWIKVMLVTNNLIYFMLIVSFGYWGLYRIWN